MQVFHEVLSVCVMTQTDRVTCLHLLVHIAQMSIIATAYCRMWELVVSVLQFELLLSRTAVYSCNS